MKITRREFLAAAPTVPVLVTYDRVPSSYVPKPGEIVQDKGIAEVHDPFNELDLDAVAKQLGRSVRRAKG